MPWWSKCRNLLVLFIFRNSSKKVWEISQFGRWAFGTVRNDNRSDMLGHAGHRFDSIRTCRACNVKWKLNIDTIQHFKLLFQRTLDVVVFRRPLLSLIIRLLLAFHYLKPIKSFYQFPLNDAVVNHLGTKVFNIDYHVTVASFMRRRKKRTFWRKRKACPILCVLMRCFNQEFAAFSNMDKVRWIIHQKECKIAFYCSYLNCLQLG